MIMNNERRVTDLGVNGEGVSIDICAQTPQLSNSSWSTKFKIAEVRDEQQEFRFS